MSMSWISDKSEQSVIGKDIVVTGDVKSDGAVRIDGQVNGNVRCTTLVTGEAARIVGEIDGNEVTVHGHVEGSINAGNVLIKASGRVDGDIASQSLAIEHGAVFAGHARPVQDSNIETLKVVAG